MVESKLHKKFRLADENLRQYKLYRIVKGFFMIPFLLIGGVIVLIQTLWHAFKLENQEQSRIDRVFRIEHECGIPDKIKDRRPDIDFVKVKKVNSGRLDHMKLLYENEKGDVETFKESRSFAFKL